MIFRFVVIHAFDGQTDVQTEFSSLDRVCIPCSAVKTTMLMLLVVVMVMMCVASSTEVVTCHVLAHQLLLVLLLVVVVLVVHLMTLVACRLVDVTRVCACVLMTGDVCH